MKTNLNRSIQTHFTFQTLIFTKMPGVTKKNKQKAVVKASPAKVEKKFISESVSFTSNFAHKQIPSKKARFLVKSCKSRKRDLKRRRLRITDVAVSFISSIYLMASMRNNCVDISHNSAPSHACDWLDLRKHSAQRAMLSLNSATLKLPRSQPMP